MNLKRLLKAMLNEKFGYAEWKGVRCSRTLEARVQIEKVSRANPMHRGEKLFGG